jgi:hypothetical protein
MEDFHGKIVGKLWKTMGKTWKQPPTNGGFGKIVGKS